MRQSGTSDHRRLAAETRGRRAETRALLLLLAKGYLPLARRWRSPVGELDLIVKRGSTVAFVEVKARADMDSAAHAITPHQQRRLIAASQAWLALNPAFARYTLRFDAVLVVPRRLPRHMPDAFRL
ncbi:MAG: YraN family protein [Tepidamorphaceae bacterium]